MKISIAEVEILMILKWRNKKYRIDLMKKLK